jgi:septum formation protein
MTHRMFSTCQPLILASSSPRRQHFLRNLGLEFTVITADIDETPLPGEPPGTFARRMARAKAQAVAGTNPDSWVIGADTVVTLRDGTILGKPGHEKDAMAMLTLLNNATHRVMTGMCLCCIEQAVETTLVETTEVTFTNVPEKVLRAYIHTGEPMDKAGAYGIQGLGSFLVQSINGSCTNVIGLPVSRLITLLLAHKIIDTPR